MPSQVCMLVHNPFVHDSRVLKEASTLRDAGYEVTVVARLDERVPKREVRGGIHIIRVDGEPRPSKAVRRLIAWRRASERPGAGGDAMRLVPVGGVVSQSAARKPGIRGRALRAALRAHLDAAWATYCTRAYGVAAALSADITVAHDLETLPVGVLLRRSGGRLIYDSHELFVESGMVADRVHKRLWSAAESRLIRHADRVMTVSDSIADELSSRYGVQRPMVVLNVPPRLNSPPAPVDLLRRLDIPRGERIVLYLGGLAPGRGLEELVLASGQLAGATLVLMGPGERDYRRRLEQLAPEPRRLRVAPAVPIDELPAWAAAADLGVVPYPDISLNHRYALPTKLFEYLAAGVPVVASDLPEIRRVLERHDAGLTFSDGSPPGIAATIEDMLRDERRLVELRAHARQAHDHLNWQREGQRLLNLADELSDVRP